MTEFERLLSKYKYAELRVEEGAESVVRINDGEVKIACGTYRGMSARVLKGGAWGFASSDRPCGPLELLRRAERLCALEKGSVRVAGLRQVRKRVRHAYRWAAPDEQVKPLLEAEREMRRKGIVSRRVSCSGRKVRKEYYNSEGSEIVQETGYAYLACVAIAKEGAVMERGSESRTSRKGFHDIDPVSAAREAEGKALRLARAKPSPKGRFTVVLDPEMTGVFSHEAVGHASEADSVIERESVLAGKVGKRIGNALVTIVDDPTAPYFGQYDYDDEGVEAKKAVLIRDGAVEGFINSRETAKRLGARPNGHARAADFQAVPVVRMSNTFFMPGKSPKEDVFDIRAGIYLKGMRGGSVDIFSGGFMFKADEAYDIRNGEVGAEFRGAALSGSILTTLKSVSCVGKDFGTSPGMCGKMGQEAPVSDGGPHIRVDGMMVG